MFYSALALQVLVAKPLVFEDSASSSSSPLSPSSLVVVLASSPLVRDLGLVSHCAHHRVARIGAKRTCPCTWFFVVHAALAKKKQKKKKKEWSSLLGESRLVKKLTANAIVDNGSGVCFF